MSSARKLQRRMTQRPDVMGSLQQAIKAAENIKGLQGDLQGLGQLGELLEETKNLVENLTGDVQKLERMALVQQEVTIRLCAKISSEFSVEAIRQFEAEIRQQVEET
jgi:hypothetical protein